MALQRIKVEARAVAKIVTMGAQNVSAARRPSSFNMERKNDMGVLESTAGFGRSESIPISSQKPTRCWDLALPEALGNRCWSAPSVSYICLKRNMRGS